MNPERQAFWAAIRVVGILLALVYLLSFVVHPAQ